MALEDIGCKEVWTDGKLIFYSHDGHEPKFPHKLRRSIVSNMAKLLSMLKTAKQLGIDTHAVRLLVG